MQPLLGLIKNGIMKEVATTTIPSCCRQEAGKLEKGDEKRLEERDGKKKKLGVGDGERKREPAV